MKILATFLAIVAAGIVAVSPAYSGNSEYHKDKEKVKISDPDEHNQRLNQCIKAALERHPGAVTEVEVEIEDGKTIIDVDIQGKDGKNWEIECDATTGEVLEDKEDSD